MTAVLLALGAAVSFGLADFTGGFAGRRTSAWSVAVVVQVVSALGIAAIALGQDAHPTGADYAWALAAGVANGVGTAFLYRGLASGRMGVVAPISGVGTAVIPIVVGVALGERPSWLAWAGIVVAIPGIWLVSREPDAPDPGASGPGAPGPGAADPGTADPGAAAPESTRSAILDGALAGIGFGLLFVFLDRFGEDAGLMPLALNQAVGGVAVIAIAVAARAVWVPRSRWALLGIAAGLTALLANTAFLLATRSGYLSVTAVITSLYPAVTVLLAMAVLRERIHLGQAVGLALCATTVVLVAGGG